MLRSPLHFLVFWLVVALVLLLLDGCRAPTLPHPATPGCHPACPGASAAAVGDAGAVLRGTAVPSAPAQALEGARAPSTAAYLCPMHLHFGAQEPGRCGECGMTLVPRAQALKSEQEHAHGS